MITAYNRNSENYIWLIVVIIGAVLLAAELIVDIYISVPLLWAGITIITAGIVLKVKKRRHITKLKVQGRRIDIYYNDGWKTEIKTFRVKSLQGKIVESHSILKKITYTLHIMNEYETICSLSTSDGFEYSKLKIIYSVLKQD